MSSYDKLLNETEKLLGEVESKEDKNILKATKEHIVSLKK